MTRSPALAALLALSLGACASNGPPPVLLTLPAAQVATRPAPSPADTGRTLVLRRVEVPEYLQSRRVRYRADASTLQEWPNVAWAERLEIGVTRELAAALRRALPGWTICEGTCATGEAELSLQVSLRPLDVIRPDGALHGSARWSLSRTSGTEQLAAQQFELRVPLKMDSAQGQAMAISDFLQAVAKTVSDPARSAPRSSLRPAPTDPPGSSRP